MELKKVLFLLSLVGVFVIITIAIPLYKISAEISKVHKEITTLKTELNSTNKNLKPITNKLGHSSLLGI